MRMPALGARQIEDTAFRSKNRHRLGGIGIIHDGTPQDKTDAAWVEDFRNHLRLMEEKSGLHPDQDIFQSWIPVPLTLCQNRNRTA